MGVTQIDTQKMIIEITDELVKKGLTNIKEIRIEPFAIGAYIHANVSVSFFENSTDSQNQPPENIELNMKRELDAFPIHFHYWDKLVDKIDIYIPHLWGSNPMSADGCSEQTQLKLLLTIAKKIELKKAMDVLQQILNKYY